MFCMVFLVMFVFPQNAKEIGNGTLTLTNALALAFAQSSEFRNAQIALEKAELQWSQAQPLMQSSVLLNAQYSLAEGVNNQTLKNPFEFSVGASIPLLSQLSLSTSYTIDGKLGLGLSYIPFKSTADLRQLLLQLEKAKLAFASVKQSITQATVSYYNLAENAAYALQYSKLLEKLAEENYLAAEIEFGKGYLSYYELSAVESSYFNAQQNSIKAHNDYMTALFNLSVYLRSDVADIATYEKVPDATLSLSPSEEQLRNHLPFETFLDRQKDYSELLLEYRAKKDSLQPVYPDLTLQCNAQYDTANNAVGMTLGGTIKLGTGLFTQTTFNIQKLDLSQAESALADLYGKYKNLYEVLLRQIRQYTIACSSSYMQYKKAEQNYGNMERLFEQGMANSRDLLQAQIALANSLVQYFQFYGTLRERLASLGVFSEETAETTVP